MQQRPPVERSSNREGVALTESAAISSELPLVTLDEGNRLAAALVAQLAERENVRVLLIKGLSLEYHGLRTGRESADVDFLVEPGQLPALIAKLLHWGWQERPTTLLSQRFTTHSRTLLQPGWPNDLDLHAEFPGLLAGSAVAFEVLWRDRVRASIAGQPCWIPKRDASMVVWALHSLRGPVSSAREQLELTTLKSEIATLGAMQRQSLADTAAELGASEILQPHLDPSGTWLQPSGAVDTDAWGSWKRKLQGGAPTPSFAAWRQILVEARPAERPHLVFRAVWPSRADLLVSLPEIRDTAWGRGSARIARWGRGIRRVAVRGGES